MNKKMLLMLGLAGVVGAGFAAKNDPVVMRVAGRDVPRSEFEYLYNKNAGQQLEEQSLDDYAELFKIYKLKVADALAEGLDTTQAFTREFRGYQAELAHPYMVDSTYYYQLLRDIYGRLGEEVEAQHIMIFKPREFGGMVSRTAYDIADSLLTELRNGADFATLAERHSHDRGSASRGGRMGYITASQTPYAFETAVYTTPEGQITGIVDCGQTLHIVKGGKHRNARGQVEAQHILKLVPADATPQQQAVAKAEIDSIYRLVTAPGADFTQYAVRLSDDKGSARQGGSVGWFGSGRMVEEFDSAAFALGVGEISEPVRTAYGWHIIKKTGARPVGSYEDNVEAIRQTVDNPRGPYQQLLYSEFGEKLRKKYKFKENTKLWKQIKESALASGTDSTFFSMWNNNPADIATWNGASISAKDFMDYLSRFASETSAKAAPAYLQTRFDNYINAEMMKRYRDDLPAENAAYRNLLGEYRDGMLLFEISNRRVWDRASQDAAGLEAFFQANRADYTWQSPRVKGLLIQAPTDSLMEAVQLRITQIPAAEALETLRKEFPDVKFDRVLAAQGDNILVDALAFGGEAVQNPDSKYPYYFMADMRVLSEPETAADVRGQVTADYQNELERRWIEELKAKYPVEVFPKELKKVKTAKR
ncbi:MAG: peptidylprolyl isomerase [Muribaculaceae bacterium]|nr:peptidylprolyl isomerase [Muribaculaceae bacterium]